MLLYQLLLVESFWTHSNLESSSLDCQFLATFVRLFDKSLLRRCNNCLHFLSDALIMKARFLVVKYDEYYLC